MTNAMPPTSPVAREPRRFLALLPLLALLVVTGRHWLELFGLWNDTSTLGHGWLLLGLIAWELWQRRQSISGLQLSFDPLLLGWLLAVLAVWAASIWLGIENLRLTLLPVLLLVAIGVATGREGLRVLAFPILLLLFATPIWFYVQPVLRAITVVVVSFLVRAVGITALIEGPTVILPSGSLTIADSCSGVHQFVVAALIGTVFACWNADDWRSRGRIVALACGIAIVTNWIRVFALIVIGYVTDMQHYFVRVDHYWFGWALFAVSMAVFFVSARRMAERPRRPASQGT